MKLTRLASTVAALLVAAAPALAQEEKVLNIANWAEYIGETTVRDFDSNAVLLAKMAAGRSGYHIVVPSSDFGRTMIDAPWCKRSTAASCPVL